MAANEFTMVKQTTNMEAATIASCGERSWPSPGLVKGAMRSQSMMQLMHDVCFSKAW